MYTRKGVNNAISYIFFRVQVPAQDPQFRLHTRERVQVLPTQSPCLAWPAIPGRTQTLIIMTLHKLHFNVNKETNIIISPPEPGGGECIAGPKTPIACLHLCSPFLLSPFPSRSESRPEPDVKVRTQTWRIICGRRKIFPVAVAKLSCHMQLAAI